MLFDESLRRLTYYSIIVNLNTVSWFFFSFIIQCILFYALQALILKRDPQAPADCQEVHVKETVKKHTPRAQQSMHLALSLVLSLQ